MIRAHSLLAATSLAALLAGCHSNNGNGKAVFPPGSFTEVGPNQTVVIGGSSRAVSLVEVDGVVTVESGPTLAETTFTVGTDDEGDVDSLRVEAPDLSLDQTLNDANATDAEETVATSLADPSSIEVVSGTANDDSFEISVVTGPTGAPYEYQVFGQWALNTSTTSQDLGYFTAGFPTDTAGAPSSGELTYEGILIGTLIQDEEVRDTFANVSVVVDFGPDQDFTFDSTNTQRDNGAGSFINASSLDLTGGGDLTGTSLAGVVTASGGSGSGGLTGTVDGMLYGPGAEEVGGTFEATNGDRVYIGAFGGAVVVP